METHSKHLQDVQAEVEVLEADYATSAADLQVIRENVANAEAALETAKDQLEDMKTDLDEKTAFIKQFRALEMELKQKLDEAGKSMEDSKRKLEHWRAKHDELRLEYVDDDDEEETEAVQGESNSADAEADAEAGATLEAGEEAGDEEAKEAAKPVKKEKGQRHPKDEIPVYTDDELDGLNRDQLVGRVSLLEGERFDQWLGQLLTMRRTSGQSTKHECSGRIPQAGG
ncbi:hypothetical protein CALCODRAFT_140382 [Calocera cornea HHB12733]|uniref:Uncharacterized protein n=1 Tax=Calocera cornea HHB12733 TaxID=1353952 RepID=A0A165K4K8_9BASI|nr:hypothetical protein CALCODRAFT_140382 [Calocera cornea HHB12733]